MLILYKLSINKCHLKRIKQSLYLYFPKFFMIKAQFSQKKIENVQKFLQNMPKMLNKPPSNSRYTNSQNGSKKLGLKREMVERGSKYIFTNPKIFRKPSKYCLKMFKNALKIFHTTKNLLNLFTTIRVFLIHLGFFGCVLVYKIRGFC